MILSGYSAKVMYEREVKKMGYKYPYIPKQYYAAVMFACKMIRENGYFNKAISTAANYYNVDEDELAKHVRARQGAGQKGTTRKYKWFLLLTYDDVMQFDDCGTLNSWSYYTEGDWRAHSHKRVIKATSLKNAKSQVEMSHPSQRYEYFEVVCNSAQFDTEKEAKQKAKSLSWSDAAKLMNIEKLNHIMEA